MNQIQKQIIARTVEDLLNIGLLKQAKILYLNFPTAFKNLNKFKKSVENQLGIKHT